MDQLFCRPKTKWHGKEWHAVSMPHLVSFLFWQMHEFECTKHALEYFQNNFFVQSKLYCFASIMSHG